MGWISLRQQKVKRGDGYVDLMPGDPIPEAEHWPNRQAWVNQKSIKFVTDTPGTTPAAPAAPPAPPPPAEGDQGAGELTAAGLKKLPNKELVELASNRFKLKLSGKLAKAKLVEAVLEAQKSAADGDEDSAADAPDVLTEEFLDGLPIAAIAELALARFSVKLPGSTRKANIIEAVLEAQQGA